MTGRNWVGAIVGILALAACDTAGGFSSDDENPFAPAGIDTSEESVDGLIVGHRLMEAGEYELAIKAYSRAAIDTGLTADVLSAVGSAELKLGRLGQAEKHLREAIELDEEFAPAWNNLGVVLMERGEYGEASRVFKTAFALDSGESVEIRDNLQLSLAKMENPTYSVDDTNFALVRRGPGEFELLSTP